jgi:hypothetical protein
MFSRWLPVTEQWSELVIEIPAQPEEFAWQPLTVMCCDTHRDTPWS